MRDFSQPPTCCGPSSRSTRPRSGACGGASRSGYGGQAGQPILQGATRLGHRRRSRPGDGPDGAPRWEVPVNGPGARPPSPASRSSRGRFQRAPRSTPHRSSLRSDAVSRSPPSAAIRRHACSCGRSTRAMPLPSKGPTERSTRSGRPTACRSGFRPRQTDESGGRRRRTGRHLRCAGREGRRVESHGDDRVRPEHDLRGTLPGVGGRRPGATRDAGRLRPR